MDLLYEDMICVYTWRYRCRIWRGLKQGQIGVDFIALEVRRVLRTYNTIPNMLQFLILLPEVNSAEIVDRWGGNGMCVHKDWP